MTGSDYDVSVAQLEYHRALHPYAHMLFMQMQEEQPDTTTVIMKRISLKAFFKEWLNKAHKNVQSDMQQLHLIKTFKPVRWKELDNTQRKSVLEFHIFMNQKRDVKMKGKTVAGGNKQSD